MALFNEFRFGDGVLYGALSKVLRFVVSQGITGGAVHGAVQIDWDVTEFSPTSVMIVANPRTPATVPEEGTVVYLDWAGTTEGSEIVYSEQGKWTYYSLFLLNNDGRWIWTAFTLFLPVSDWGYQQYLPRLLPGVAVSKDMNVRAEPDTEVMLVQWLEEFGFLLDEVKTAGEALLPFWAGDNIAPQAAPVLASLMNLDYLVDLGPKVYSDLISLGGYADNTLGVLGQKSEIVTRWSVNCRDSNNHYLNLNDSSGEGPNRDNNLLEDRYQQSRWDNGFDQGPYRIGRDESVPRESVPGIFEKFDLQTRGYLQFPEGNWTCGNPLRSMDSHGINIRTWPTAVGGFFARLPPGSAGAVDITYSIVTKPFIYGMANPGLGLTETLLIARVETNAWTWFSSEAMAVLGTDQVGFPQMVITFDGAVADPDVGVVDIDVALMGPGKVNTRATPGLAIHETGDFPGEVFLISSRGPEYGTAYVSWGDGTSTTEVSWLDLANGIKHTYYGHIGERRKVFHITAKDQRDEWVYASVSIALTDLGVPV